MGEPADARVCLFAGARRLTNRWYGMPMCQIEGALEPQGGARRYKCRTRKAVSSGAVRPDYTDATHFAEG